MNGFEIIWYKAFFELKAEAARGSLGMIWWVLEPLLYLAALSVVFIAIRQRSGEDFLAFLFVGLIVWKWFAASLSHGINSIAGHTGLMRQVYIPKYYFPLISLLINTSKFLVVFGLLLFGLVVFGFEPSFAWLALPVIIFVQMVMILGATYLFSWAVCFINDLKIMVDNSLLFLFFLSGIIFDISKAPDGIREYLFLNPLLILVDSFRAILLKGTMPDWSALGYVMLFSVAFLLTGLLLVKKHDRLIPKVVLR